MNTVKFKLLIIGIEITTRYNWWYWAATTYIPPAVHLLFS